MNATETLEAERTADNRRREAILRTAAPISGGRFVRSDINRADDTFRRIGTGLDITTSCKVCGFDKIFAELDTCVWCGAFGARRSI